MKLKCWEPVFGLGELKGSLLIEWVGGAVKLRTGKPIKRGTGMFNETKKVIVEVNVRSGGAGSFV